VTFVRNLSSWRVISSSVNMYNTVGCICFHEMYVRNLLQWKATWTVSYAFILGVSIFMCKKSFRTQHNLKWHLCTCAEYCPFSCDVCKKLFSNQGNLKIRLCTDTGECPFSVIICKTSYTFHSIWNLHLCAHTGQCVC